LKDGAANDQVVVLARRYSLFTLALVALIVVLAVAERAGIKHAWMAWGLLGITLVAYAALGFACRTTDEAEYFVAGRRVPAVFNGLAAAADWMSAASFLGTAGVLYVNGFAGLAYIVGWTGGFCVLALLLAPYLRRVGLYTVADFLAARYGGIAPRVLGAVAAIAVSFVYLVVQIYGVGLITSHLTGFGFEVGIMVGLGGVLVCSFLGGMRAVTWTQVAQYIVLIVAYTVPVTWMSLRQTGSPVPVVTYGERLQQVQAREAALQADPQEQAVRALQRQRAAEAERKLADPRAAMSRDAEELARRIAALRHENAPLVVIQRLERELAQRPRSEEEARQRYTRERDQALARAQPLAGLAPQATPFAQGDRAGDAAARERFENDRRNFVALILCLMLGTAAMPHLLVRFNTTPTAAEARSSVAWTLLFVTVLYLAAPALAVLVKVEVLTHLVGLPFTELPAWVGRWTKLDPGLISVRDLNGDGRVQLGELFIGADMVVLAAPEVGGLPYWVTCLVAAGGLAAALSTADALLLTIANSISHDLYYRVLRPDAPAVVRVIISKVFVMAVAVVAALTAAMRNTDIVQFIAAAFSLAAATFFPALVVGIFWRRANRAGAVAAMVTGFGVCLYYMVTNMAGPRALLKIARPLAECQWWGIEPVAAGVFGVPAGLAALVVVSLLTPPPGTSTQSLLDRLRVPG